MNAPVTQAAEGLPRRAFTVVEVERMVEVGLIDPDERLEILGGEIVPMSPKGAKHEAVKVALAKLWGKTCPPDYVVAPETGLRLDQLTYLEPDFVVYEQGVGLANLRGPDVLLAVEVADSSLNYDLKRKPAFYATYGVRELWVIDAKQRIVHVHRDPTPTGYADVALRKPSDDIRPSVAPKEFSLVLNDLERV